MASHEHLDQLGNSSTTTDDDDDDASTSSEDENGVAPMRVVKQEADHKMQVDSASPDSVSKPRIKLTLRASLSGAAASAEGAVNGAIKKDSNGGVDENKKPPPSLPVVKKESPLPPPPIPEATAPAAVAKSNDAKPVNDPATNTAGKKVEVGSNGAKSQGGSSNGTKKRKLSLESPVVKAESSAPQEAKGKPSATTENGAIPKKKKKKKTTDGMVKGEPTATAVNGASKAAPSGSSPTSEPPKKKKKKVPKLPMSTKRKLPSTKADPTAQATTATVVKATVVANDEAVEEDAVATVIVEPPAPATAKPQPPPNKAPAAATVKRKSSQPQGKAIRLPPMTSPGLLLPSQSSGLWSDAKSGLAKPEALFAHTMAQAGYTTQNRMMYPHRGSSVKRVVGDMFDSNVAFTLHFPNMVPRDLWTAKAKTGTNNGAEDEQSKTSLPELLVKSLGKTGSAAKESQVDAAEVANKRENGSRKRPRPCQISDMMPVSLTLPYPESYIEKRLQYVKEAQERERMIILRQTTQEKLEIAQEEKDYLNGKPEGTPPTSIFNPVTVPPIPIPPPAPPLTDFKGLNTEQYEGTHPIYVPKGKKNFVAHLDQDCFHITEGRYFGLSSNFIADPHFVGANAPGISGLTLSVGSGLATTSTSSGNGVLAMTSVLAVPPAHPSSKSSGTTAASSEKAPKKEASTSSKPAKKAAAVPSVNPTSKSKSKSANAGWETTATQADLRKAVDALRGTEMAEKMKTCIIRAAVHASRAGQHGQPFMAPDGITYPDVSKAFAAHGGLKPCTRCKNNKQGAYHCRLRRKHNDADYDGGNSYDVLAPLLLVPMEDLLLDQKKSD